MEVNKQKINLTKNELSQEKNLNENVNQKVDTSKNEDSLKKVDIKKKIARFFISEEEIEKEIKQNNLEKLKYIEKMKKSTNSEEFLLNFKKYLMVNNPNITQKELDQEISKKIEIIKKSFYITYFKDQLEQLETLIKEYPELKEIISFKEKLENISEKQAESLRNSYKKIQK